MRQTYKKSKSIISNLKVKIKKLEKDKSNLQQSIDVLNTIDISKQKNWDLLTISENKSLKEECIAITTLSDTHAEEKVVASVINNLNEYNPDIAIKRINLFFKRLLYIIRMHRRTGKKIDKLILALLGDLITGAIHETLRANTQARDADLCSDYHFSIPGNGMGRFQRASTR